MDKSCHSSGESTTTTTSSGSSNTNNRDQYLKQLSKLSHKISKPIIKKPTFDHHPQAQNLHHQHQHQHQNHQAPPPPPPPPLPAAAPAQGESQLQQQNQNLQAQQHQPPVYNINKNDFRDVVQKLTGSPAHERFSTPPPIQPPKPPSSRLQRIRPPPLAHVSNRPPPLLNCGNPIIPPPTTTTATTNFNPNHSMPTTTAAGTNFIQRSASPLSPLPPFPSVHAAAESPISAYMRFLHSSMSTVDSNPKQFSGFSPLAPLVSPRWNNLTAPQQHQQQIPLPQQGILPSPTSAMIGSQSQFQLPSSPLPFGCLNSPRSSYPLLSPSLLFSPSSGQFPLSPTVPVPSPRWRGL